MPWPPSRNSGARSRSYPNTRTRGTVWASRSSISAGTPRRRDAYQRATQIESKGDAAGGSYVNLALSLQGDGRTIRSAASARAQPGTARRRRRARQLCAGVNALAGRLAEGWTHFEFRWLREPLLGSRPSLAKPVWKGQDLRGKTILLRAEQGLGDTLQFIRYAPHVKAQGATVLLSAQNALRELLRDFPGVDRMLRPDDSLPHIDYYVHLLSLPGIFAHELAIRFRPTSLTCVPIPPRVERWATATAMDRRRSTSASFGRQASTTCKDRDRSMSLRMLGRRGTASKACASIRCKRDRRRTRPTAPPPGLNSWTSARSSPISPTRQRSSHRWIWCLGGHGRRASCRRAWASRCGSCFPQPAEWRWMEDRDDSPWYPTMRLFRQRERGDWADVVERVKAALQTRAQDAGARTSSTAAVELPKRRANPCGPSRCCRA